MTTIAQTFTTTDGKTFSTRKEASDHQAYATRVAKVLDVLNAADEAGLTEGKNTAQVIATLADQLVVALANPLNRGRKVKVEAPAA